MKRIVSLGYAIFKTKYVCDTLTEKLDQFSESIHTFNSNNNTGQENESEHESSSEEDMAHADDPTSDVVIELCSSVKQFWEGELENIKKTNSFKEVNGDSNKYYMPAFSDYVAKNYLPSCILWSNL